MLKVENLTIRNPRNCAPEILAFIEKIEVDGWEFIAFTPPMVPHQVPPPLACVFRRVAPSGVLREDVYVKQGEKKKPVFPTPGSATSEKEKVAVGGNIKPKRKPGRPRKNA